MFTTLFNSATGAVPLVSALTALLLGTTVLFVSKGTSQHKQVGYGGDTFSIGVITTTTL